MILLLLTYEFFMTGLLAVGGGLATIPFLSGIATKYDWFTYEQLAEMIVLAESLPGPIGANLAVFAGFRAEGVLGGIVAVIALVTPSVIVIAFVSKFLQKYRENRIVDNTFALLRPMSAGLIAGAVFPLMLTAIMGIERTVNPIAIGLFAGMTVLVFATDKYKVHPLIFIAIGAVAGIVLGGI